MTSLAKERSIHILLVEDNAGDIRLMIEAFREVRNDVVIHSITDGHQALKYLRREGAFASSPRPDLILLDLNLPGIDGRHVLDQIKQDPDLKTIPVIVLTTSGAEEDVIRAYASHANCYIQKPINLDLFFHIVATIEQSWLRVVRLPEDTGSRNTD